ncbi:16S rRNA (cytosine(1402)-N(4))-methyltransferase RsmH [candidate division WOR-3 bacterium]|nr:16S rRNA (cytosine(1402)-N(4))-methyltransferase RsmH [candidate division WOR-3 bacterium]
MAEVIRYMRLQPGNTYCDCTAGGGGHLLQMLQASPESTFIGIDWDPDAIAHAQSVLQAYHDQCTLIQGNFAEIDLILERLKLDELDGILFDCGVSLYQVTTPARGFSYDHDGPLLMRMSPNTMALKERLRSISKHELAFILRSYGDVRGYRRIAELLYARRMSLRTTVDIRTIVEQGTPKRFQKKNCRRVFQALRIWVNDELNNLANGLAAAFERLRVGGRLIAIAYHSGEDRIIKRQFREHHANKRGVLLAKKVIRPSAEEVRVNPRARSARLRVCEKCA